jgi:hypothetical protein
MTHGDSERWSRTVERLRERAEGPQDCERELRKVDSNWGDGLALTVGHWGCTTMEWPSGCRFLVGPSGSMGKSGLGWALGSGV